MESNHHQPAARPQDPLCRGGPGGELRELIVAQYAQGLKGPGGRMDCARMRVQEAGNDIGERAGRAYGRAAPRTHDGASDSARVTLLSEDCEDSCEIPLRHGSNDLCRGRPIIPHAHVERPLVTEGKSTGSLVELPRGG